MNKYSENDFIKEIDSLSKEAKDIIAQLILFYFLHRKESESDES